MSPPSEKRQQQKTFTPRNDDDHIGAEKRQSKVQGGGSLDENTEVIDGKNVSKKNSVPHVKIQSQGNTCTRGNFDKIKQTSQGLAKTRDEKAVMAGKRGQPCCLVIKRNNKREVLDSMAERLVRHKRQIAE